MTNPHDFNRFTEMFEQMFGQMSSQTGDLTGERFKRWAEAQRNIVQQYRQTLQQQLQHDPFAEALSSLTKLMMTSFQESTRMQRDARRSCVEAQIEMADHLLAMLDRFSCDSGTATPPGTSHGPSTPPPK